MTRLKAIASLHENQHHGVTLFALDDVGRLWAAYWSTRAETWEWREIPGPPENRPEGA